MSRNVSVALIVGHHINNVGGFFWLLGHGETWLRKQL